MSQFLKLNLMDQLNFLNWNIDLYNDMVIFLESLIAISVMLFIFGSFINKNWNQSFSHWLVLELIWTVIPMIVLLFLGFPSLKLLYISEIYNFSSNLTLKVMSHQWYWEYDFPEFNLNLESYPELLSGMVRLSESSLLVLPISCKIRSIITSSDVLHSWALPSMGFKIDSIPGRLNFYMLLVMMPGKHYGQCSELCGNYHSWMPIYIEFTSLSIFMEWLKTL